MDYTDNEKLQIIYGDVTLGIHGTGFHYIFSYQTGGPESLVKHGKEWLYRTPKPTFWRATTDNDRGNGFSRNSAMWLGADLFTRCTQVQVKVDHTLIPLPVAPENNKYKEEEWAKCVELIYDYETATVPVTQVHVHYTIVSGGEIHVEVHYEGKEQLPELPVFGMRFLMPTKATGFIYEGLSGETYPDRMDGGVRGTYEVTGLPVTPYLVPQECGMHMETDRVTVYRDTVLDNRARSVEKTGLTFRKGKEPFGFSCIPYTAEELENASHQEELPVPRRTVLCICGAVRGVGGIDSWGADVREGYHIDASKDIRYDFYIV